MDTAGAATSTLAYSVHHNWEWIVDDALAAIAAEQSAVAVKLRFSQLPSVIQRQARRDRRQQQQKAKRIKPGYALFRCELVRSAEKDADAAAAAWCTSRVFEKLDPKDALFKLLRQHGQAGAMPHTMLLPWDAFAVGDIAAALAAQQAPADLDLERDRYYLKASLGSGGFGIYFVRSLEDIAEVIRSHAERASRYPGFLDDLRDRYGQVPDWSLQRMVASIRTGPDQRKTQVRAYVVYCAHRLYVYRTFEVRLPIWAQEAQNASVVEATPPASGTVSAFQLAVESELVGAGAARPYNEARIKKDTERVLLEEIPELDGAYPVILDVLTAGFGPLRDYFEAIWQEDEALAEREMEEDGEGDGVGSRPAQLAVAGVDLVVEHDADGKGFRAFIVELNNNPAMPGRDKQMSPRYRAHLHDFLRSVLLLGLVDCSTAATAATTASAAFLPIF